MDLKRFITKQNDKKIIMNDQTQKDIKMFIQNLCATKHDDGEADDNSQMASGNKRAKTAGNNGRRRVPAFERAPIFEEILKLQKGNKIDSFTDMNTVGWGSMNSNYNPLNGVYMGGPQAQANKSRMHLKSAGDNGGLAQ